MQSLAHLEKQLGQQKLVATIRSCVPLTFAQEHAEELQRNISERDRAYQLVCLLLLFIKLNARLQLQAQFEEQERNIKATVDQAETELAEKDDAINQVCPGDMLESPVFAHS